MSIIKFLKPESMADMRIYQISTRFFKLGLMIWNRLEIIGAQNIPNEGGILIASNHSSYLDPPVIGVGYRKRPVHFVARDTLWSSPFPRWWLNKVGCIPVSRDSGDTKALKLTIKALKKGQVVSIFPEGTRSENGEIRDVKPGIGFIVKHSMCTVIPAYINGSFMAFPKNSKWIKPNKITICFGEPITPDIFQNQGFGRDAYNDHAKLIMNKIRELKDQFYS